MAIIVETTQLCEALDDDVVFQPGKHIRVRCNIIDFLVEFMDLLSDVEESSFFTPFHQ